MKHGENRSYIKYDRKSRLYIFEDDTVPDTYSPRNLITLSRDTTAFRDENHYFYYCYNNYTVVDYLHDARNTRGRNVGAR